MPALAQKHKLEGIGEATAALTMAALAANPQTVFLTGAVVGKIIWFVIKLLAMGGASIGLVVVNVGAAKVETIITENTFDGSWESAQKLIKAIIEQGREVTDAEARKIDEPVKAAFRKFGRFGRRQMRVGGDT